MIVSSESKTRGGSRTGAGRKAGNGRFGEETKPVRLPVSMIDEVMRYVNMGGYSLPLYSCKVQAGLPVAADDYVESFMDLNEYIVKNPSATFFVRVNGDSMTNAGINENDILAVDRKIEVKAGKIVVAAIEGELTVKRLVIINGKSFLRPENEKYEDIDITGNDYVVIWGVVTNIIRSL